VELSTEAASFRLPQGLTPGQLERRLASRFRAAFSPETVEAKTFHDSFDWRIHESGGTYQTVGSGARRLHVWRDADGRVRHRLRHPGDPGFGADLPPGLRAPRGRPSPEAPVASGHIDGCGSNHRHSRRREKTTVGSRRAGKLQPERGSSTSSRG
jgi:hypothetical protein